MSNDQGWIGVDLDGTLAEYHGWNEGKIGAPIKPMVDRVKQWLEEGRRVKIFTARANEGAIAISEIRLWCAQYIGQELEVTATKDYLMLELWDDRAIQVVSNTGEPYPARKRRRR